MRFEVENYSGQPTVGGEDPLNELFSQVLSWENQTICWKVGVRQQDLFYGARIGTGILIVKSFVVLFWDTRKNTLLR